MSHYPPNKRNRDMNTPQWKEKEREAYYKMANDLAWGACFECCDFENMLEKTADHFFAVMEMREKELIEQAKEYHASSGFLQSNTDKIIFDLQALARGE